MSTREPAPPGIEEPAIEEPAIERLADRLRPVFAAHPEIAAVYLFGSVARGEARPGSDIDLGVVFQRRGDTAHHHHRLIGRLAYDIAKVSGHDRVDLVVLESQGSIFCPRGQLLGL